MCLLIRMVSQVSDVAHGPLVMFCDVFLYQMQNIKNFDSWDKKRWRKGIPYLNMARSNCYSLAIVHSKGRMLRKWWQCLNYSFIGRGRRKSRIFVPLCMFMHNFFSHFRKKEYKLKRNLLNINMKINWYFELSMPLRQCIL